MRHYARDDDTFVPYCRIWQHYLRGWLGWDEASFASFVEKHGATDSGLIFHEEPWYWVFPHLVDTNGQPLPYDDQPNPYLAWQRFYWTELHRAIYRDVSFNDWTASDDAWARARVRAENVLAQFGFRLAVRGSGSKGAEVVE